MSANPKVRDCPTCGQMMAATLTKCPHCGAAVKPTVKATPGANAAAFIVLLIIGGIIWAVCAAITKSPSGPPGPGSVGLNGTATEQALCAHLDGSPSYLPPLIDAVQTDAESGLTLKLDGNLLELYLSETNNTAKVADQINKMKSDCARKAG